MRQFLSRTPPRRRRESEGGGALSRFGHRAHPAGLTQPPHIVCGLDAADRVRTGAHGQRIGVDAARSIGNTIHQIAGADTGESQRHIPAATEIINTQHVTRLEALLTQQPPFHLIARPEASLHIPTQTTDGAGAHHPFGDAADPHQHLSALEILQRRHDGAQHIAVQDLTQPRSGGTNRAQKVPVARSVQHHHREVARAHAHDMRDVPEVFAGRRRDVDRATRGGAHHDFSI